MEKLSTKEAGEILGISRRRVIALIEQGRLRAEKFSNVYMISRKDLEAVYDRKNGRPAAVEKERKRDFKTIFDLAPELIGSIKSGLPTDLSSNKEYLKDFGKKSAEKVALRKRRSVKR